MIYVIHGNKIIFIVIFIVIVIWYKCACWWLICCRCRGINRLGDDVFSSYIYGRGVVVIEDIPSKEFKLKFLYNTRQSHGLASCKIQTEWSPKRTLGDTQNVCCINSHKCFTRISYGNELSFINKLMITTSIQNYRHGAWKIRSP